MLERKKEERKLSVGAFFLLFFGVFLAIVDGIVAIVSIMLLSIGQNFRWEMLLLAAGCLMAALAAWLAIRAGLKRNKLLTELRRYRRLLDSNPSGDIPRRSIWIKTADGCDCLLRCCPPGKPRLRRRPRPALLLSRRSLSLWCAANAAPSTGFPKEKP